MGKLLILHLFSCVCIVYFAESLCDVYCFSIVLRIVRCISLPCVFCVWYESIGRYHKKHIHCAKEHDKCVFYSIYCSIVAPAIYTHTERTVWSTAKTYQKQNVDRMEKKISPIGKRACKWLRDTKQNGVRANGKSV